MPPRTEREMKSSPTMSFRFRDARLNARLADLAKRRGFGAKLERDVLRYAVGDEEVVEIDLIGAVRDEVFSRWQVLSCPAEWVAVYREYMVMHDIPFQEECANGATQFLLPRSRRPHNWKLKEPTTSSAC